ncbi:HAD family hydrolase [uncultured Tateyamaria sp.]|uniref:HAD family hydrolase n=1 Tax=uncultured Tateyamaria sp. TaxID=455651 RepID=UPI00260DBB7C|nr:HAD family hydrolase [uncultured Tateyamaria sp.]
MTVLVWDFDGVLNANIRKGRFLWADTLYADWGIRTEALAGHLFHPDRIGRIMRGHSDLRDELQTWLSQAGHKADADAFLAYWFAKDALPDRQVLQHLHRSGMRHVIGTNNEPRRADYIEQEMGFGALVEHIFASGRIGHAKPDSAYFNHIEAWSGAPAATHVLIDDTRRNVDAAQDQGWRGFHFTDETRASLPAFLDGLG